MFKVDIVVRTRIALMKHDLHIQNFYVAYVLNSRELVVYPHF
jgi:hypothetical protein